MMRCAPAQGHSRTFTHETVDLDLTQGFVKEDVCCCMILCSLAIAPASRVIKLELINSVCLPIPLSLSLFLSRCLPWNEILDQVSKEACIHYVLRVFQKCNTNSLLKQSSKADAFQIIQNDLIHKENTTSCLYIDIIFT